MAGLVLPRLRSLHADMKAKGRTRVKFDYVHGAVTFDVFFFVDETPYCLLFGAKGHNLAFELAVRAGYIVDCTLARDTYKALCRALDIKYNPANPFSPKAFLESFAGSIPSSAGRLAAPTPSELIGYRSDVEESEKKYFCGWRDNTIVGKKVTPENLHKTRRILGEAAHDVCKRKNLSSCWTPDKSLERPVTPPG